MVRLLRRGSRAAWGFIWWLTNRFTRNFKKDLTNCVWELTPTGLRVVPTTNGCMRLSSIRAIRFEQVFSVRAVWEAISMNISHGSARHQSTPAFHVTSSKII